jgi:hypothetical protein
LQQESLPSGDVKPPLGLALKARNMSPLQGFNLIVDDDPRVARCALTLGYFISRFQREEPSWRFVLVRGDQIENVLIGKVLAL